MALLGGDEKGPSRIKHVTGSMSLKGLSCPWSLPSFPALLSSYHEVGEAVLLHYAFSTMILSLITKLTAMEPADQTETVRQNRPFFLYTDFLRYFVTSENHPSH